ncbi:MAG: hypothetical protein PHR92_14435 [Lachnospiraceae bacterium]|nr:hypothetical protein [Lachnospiraceae bacterium]
MPDYKRFIAYFYEYINGKKVRNAGFVKTELRGDVWRLTLQLKGERREETVLKLYGYVRTETMRLGICLGNAYWKNGAMVQKFQVPAGEINGTGYGFEEIKGLWIPIGEGRCFLSNWDDEAETAPESLMVFEKKSDAAPKEKKEERDAAPKEKEEERDAASREKEEERDEAGEGAFREGQERFSADAESEGAENEGAESEGAENIEKTERPSQGLPQMEAGEVEHEEEEHEEEEHEGEEHEEVEHEGEEHVEEDIPAEKNKIPQMQPDHHQVRAQTVLSAGNGPMDKAWETLEKRCPAASALKDEQQMQCIQICPRDIMWMQQQDCPINRNNFLMRGFYGYRHLLLGKLEDGTYLLGVPGLYMPQQACIARSFGFPEFKTVKDASEKRGYWCRRILR